MDVEEAQSPTPEQPKKRNRRPADEVAKDYELRAQKIKWRDALEARRLLTRAEGLIEEAVAAWGNRDVTTVALDEMKGAIDSLHAAKESMNEAIPEGL